MICRKVGPTEDAETINNKIGPILGWLSIGGIVIAVIAVAIIGLRYMLGSVEEKADYKKAMIPYIIGILLIVTVTTVPTIIYNFTTFIFG